LGWNSFPPFIGGKGFFLFNMSRVLAIDFGTKKVGLAVTDTLQIAAHGLQTIPTEKLDDFLSSYMKDEPVSEIVLGLPRHADGNPTTLVPRIQKLAEDLCRKYPAINVVFQDESFTSREAQDIIRKSVRSRKKRRDKSLVDKISAVLILQRYLKHI